MCPHNLVAFFFEPLLSLSLSLCLPKIWPQSPLPIFLTECTGSNHHSSADHWIQRCLYTCKEATIIRVLNCVMTSWPITHKNSLDHVQHNAHPEPCRAVLRRKAKSDAPVGGFAWGCLKTTWRLRFYERPYLATSLSLGQRRKGGENVSCNLGQENVL